MPGRQFSIPSLYPVLAGLLLFSVNLTKNLRDVAGILFRTVWGQVNAAAGGRRHTGAHQRSVGQAFLESVMSAAEQLAVVGCR